ncbi:MAG: dihydropteroate synthase [candidate division Zixibacteria bacterium RBG_16_48_11]|nr:MAG: dihydropteroate synthase [candidate division Zixibacteria bacterium RBG_16_48_11]
MGVINVTPDSFSDGGKFFDVHSAVDHGLRLEQEGADIVDVGGESTRPGSEPILIDEELKRVIPVIEALSQKIKIPISVDTYKAEVAKKALEAGADIINDISGLRFDPKMIQVAQEFHCPVILMHIQGTPKNMQENPVYEDVVREIKDYFQERIRFAVSSGVDESRLILDPGIGFGKNFEHNLSLLNSLLLFKSLERPILVGVSRKSFVGKILDLPVTERLEGSLAALAYSVWQGANIVRVHDVKESVRAARVIDRLKNS